MILSKIKYILNYTIKNFTKICYKKLYSFLSIYFNQTIETYLNHYIIFIKKWHFLAYFYIV
jgi:hypothetical protein